MKRKVRTTFLEMRDRNSFRPSAGFESSIEIKEIQNDIYLNFMLFTGVGLPWQWYSRLAWSLEDWRSYFMNSNSKTFLGFHEEGMIGFFELDFQAEGNTEIKFFGLFPGFVGKGLGGKFLSHAISQAWGQDTTRLWVHTCDQDSEAALSNYLARGFEIYKQQTEIEHIPDKNEFLRLIAEFHNQYMEQYKTA